MLGKCLYLHVTAHSELPHNNICSSSLYQIGWFGFEFPEQDSVWFSHHHHRTLKYFIVLRQVWVWSQWRLPVRGRTLLAWDGH